LMRNSSLAKCAFSISRIQKRSATFIEFERQAGVASLLLKRPSKRNTDETLQAAYH
jgi:hypothetical protein